MVRRCCVLGCTNASHNRKGEKIDNGLSFYRFPAWRKTEGSQISEITKRRRMTWLSAVKRNKFTFVKIPLTARVCSLHFHNGKPAYEMIESHPDWAPSLHLGHNEIKQTDAARYARQQNRRLKKELDNTTKEAPKPPQDEEAQCVAQDCKPVECDFCECRRAEINRLLEENRALKHELRRRAMHEEFLKDDISKVKYYTGFPHFDGLMGVLSCVVPFLTHSGRVLSPFQMLFMTLMRLKLNLSMQHIAHMFNVDRATVSRTFNDTLNVLHARIIPTKPHQLGNARSKYKILTEKVPVSMEEACKGEDATFHDKIVTVCCALTKLCTNLTKLSHSDDAQHK